MPSHFPLLCRLTVSGRYPPCGRRYQPGLTRPGDEQVAAGVPSWAMSEEDGYFGEDVAASYDDGFEGQFDPAVIDVTADALAGLAAGGRALELAIGTGRVALPLAARGVDVHGIDLSRAMVARLRARPGGDAIPVTIGDFT